MGRVQLALNVADLGAAVEFYSRLFDAEPAKVRPGYANFAIEDPPLKLVLFEGGEPGTLNHLGIEVASVEEVAATAARAAERQLPTADGSGTCCFAVQEKVWVTGPDNAWEVYAVIADAPAEAEPAAGCCA